MLYVNLVLEKISLSGLNVVFVPRLVEWLPGLRKHECSYEEPGGFVRRLEEGTWVGHILEHVTLELQNLAGLPDTDAGALYTSQATFTGSNGWQGLTGLNWQVGAGQYWIGIESRATCSE